MEEEHVCMDDHSKESIAERLSKLDVFLGRLHDRSQRAFDELVKTNPTSPVQ
jgi:hypothetical protein